MDRFNNSFSFCMIVYHISDTYENNNYFSARYTVTSDGRDSLLTSEVIFNGSAAVNSLQFSNITVYGIDSAFLVRDVFVNSIRLSLLEWDHDPLTGVRMVIWPIINWLCLLLPFMAMQAYAINCDS